MESGTQAVAESAISKPPDDRRARKRTIILILIVTGIIVEMIGLAFYFLSSLSFFGIVIDLWSSGFSIPYVLITTLGIPIFLAGVLLWVMELKTGDPKFDKAVKWSFGIATALKFLGTAMTVLYYSFAFSNSSYFSEIYVAIAANTIDQLGILAALIGTFLLIRRAMRNGLNFTASK